MAGKTRSKSNGDSNTTSISSDPADYLSGPTGSQTSRTQGGTTRDGSVAVVGYTGDSQEPDHGQYAGPGTDLAK